MYKKWREIAKIQNEKFKLLVIVAEDAEILEVLRCASPFLFSEEPDKPVRCSSIIQASYDATELDFDDDEEKERLTSAEQNWEEGCRRLNVPYVRFGLFTRKHIPEGEVAAPLELIAQLQNFDWERAGYGVTVYGKKMIIVDCCVAYHSEEEACVMLAPAECIDMNM